MAKVAESEKSETFKELVPERVAECVCAFLNGQGGVLTVGVDDDGSVTGVPDAMMQRGMVIKHLQDKLSPDGVWSCDVESRGSEEILVVNVTGGAEKPYVMDGTIFVRHGGQSKRADSGDVSRLIKERLRADERWERRIAFGVELDELDLKEVVRAAKEIENKGRHSFENRKDAAAVLRELSLLVDGQVTNAGLVLFGQKPTTHLPQCAVRFTVYLSDKRDSEFAFDEVLEGHLFETVRELERLFPSGVASVFGESWQRSDRRVLPKEAIREAILNALVHRDLESPSGSTTVSVYPGRIEFRNLGQLPEGLSAAALSREHGSLPRNPDIAQVCFLRGWIEKVGRGTLLITEQCKEAGLKPPKWVTDALWTTLTVSSRTGTQAAQRAALNQRQIDLLGRLESGDRLTHPEYAESLTESVSDRTARSDLAELVELALLERRGRGRGTHYIRTRVPAP